ncbi:Isochorismatase hydrolase [Fomitiporia mediterranea MF3/22]|uniref:Isochorismatase hydrolase n=1 Tax=Fomitiporia mediterranea (strain MF3/22) TaxID=694068 RepID=UPI00044097F6|nr:Isochorismatase hydrolase [Fomitiporia mediterranea MF3/22]EJD01285.1 Isochorismatase hydrolase [Fomitiporia mediterranea MF3/22]
MPSKVNRLLPGHTIFFVLDLQTRFRPAIYQFDHVVSVANKMFKVAKLLDIPVIVSEQNPSKLGKSVETLNFNLLGQLHRKTIEKSLFSLVTPELDAIMKSMEYAHIKSVVLMGIESHICVLQTAFDLLDRDFSVHVLADGVSSCNKEEVPLALERMRQANVHVTTSESAIYQLIADAGKPEFKAFAQIVKEESDSNQKALQVLPGTSLSNK